eukprot:2641389-Pyramimonas_sp.AAC.1
MGQILEVTNARGLPEGGGEDTFGVSAGALVLGRRETLRGRFQSPFRGRSFRAPPRLKTFTTTKCTRFV